MGVSHRWVPVKTHSTPVLPKREEAVGCSQLLKMSSQQPHGCSPQPARSRQFSTEYADVPDVSNEERNDDRSSSASPEAPWQCKLEFSADKMVGDNKIQVEQNSLSSSRVSDQ